MDRRLTTLSLGQHDQPNQKGQRSEDPPTHRLRSDGRVDGGRIGVEISQARRAVLAGLGLEAGNVGGSMAKSHEVGMEKNRPVVDGTNERLGGVKAVVRAAGGREFVLGWLGTPRLAL